MIKCSRMCKTISMLWIVVFFATSISSLAIPSAAAEVAETIDPSRITADPGTNVALASHGGTATASSQFSDNYPVESVIDGDRIGMDWGDGGGWNDATPGDYPDWVQIDFDGSYTIDTINVFTLQDDLHDMTVPTLQMNFTKYGITVFDVQYWDGLSWVNVPGGKVTDNVNVWRQFRFAPVTTDKIRVVVQDSLQDHTRIIEIEALTESGPQIPEPGTNVAHLSNRSVATASSQYSEDYPAESVIDGDRRGYYWGYGGGWMDGTFGSHPDWVQIEFDTHYTIDTIHVYTTQDNTSVEPTLDMQFHHYGITAFEVQVWDGSSWMTVPDGRVDDNGNVWSRFEFAPVTTNKIRVVVNNALGNYSRIVEIESLTPVPDNLLSSTSKKFLDHGIMYQTWVATELSGREFPTREEWLNSNFTSVTYYEPSLYNTTLAASVPGLKWSMVSNGYDTAEPAVTRSDHYLTPQQREYLDNLTTISIGDEDIYTPQLEQHLRDVYEWTRKLYPNAVLHNNQMGNEQWNEDEMRSYIRNAKPDLITFDDYYFFENGSDIGITADIVGSTAFYRKLALEGWDGTGKQPIAFGQYVVGYKTGQSSPWDSGDYEATESQIYAVPYITLALGGKWLSMFRWEYNHEGFLLFDENRQPTRHYDWYAELGKQVKNLSPHLSRLYSSDARVLQGKHLEGETPVLNALPKYMSRFEAKPDFYLTDMTVENVGTQNNGLPGDVIIGYFDILPGIDRSFFTSSNPKYFMVANGLNTGNGLPLEQQHGSSEETKQEITLYFDFGKAEPKELNKVNCETGNVENLPLTPVKGTAYKLVLTIGGGQGELFFFDEDGPAPQPVYLPEPEPMQIPEQGPSDNRQIVIETESGYGEDESPSAATMPENERQDEIESITLRLGGNMARGKSYTKSVVPSTFYPDTRDAESTDGLLGYSFYDGKYHGYILDQSGLDVVVDLGTVQQVNQVKVHSWDGDYNYYPDQVTVSTAVYLEDFTRQGAAFVPTGPAGKWYDIRFEPTDARYVKVHFDKISDNWLFVDEILVYGPGLPPIQPYEPAPPSGTVNAAAGKSYTASALNGIVYYPDSGKELTDGQFGEDLYTDSAWQGFAEPNFHYIIDLGAEYEIRYLSANFLQQHEVTIHFPDWIKFSYSVDGTNFTESGRATRYSEGGQTAKFILSLRSPEKARYIRMEGRQAKVWTFIDEIEVWGLQTLDLLAAVLQQRMDSGEVGGPLSKQLQNSVKQAQHHMDQGAVEQAVHFVGQFLNHLHNKAMQRHLSDEAKSILDETARSLILQWTEQSP